MTSGPTIAGRLADPSERTTRGGFRGELGRKAIHLASALIPLCHLWLPAWFVVPTLAGLTGAMLLAEALRRASPAAGRLFEQQLGFMLRERERAGLTGATYVFIGALLSILLLPRDLAVTVLLILSISDTLAALVGIKFGREQFLGKSPSGSMAFFASAWVIARLCLAAPPSIVLATALIATGLEALPLRIGRVKVDDNLTIPLLTGGAVLALRAATGL